MDKKIGEKYIWMGKSMCWNGIVALKTQDLSEN
jgi:hypothetical protein